MRIDFNRRIVIAIAVVVLFTAYSTVVGISNPDGASAPSITMAQSFNNLVLTAAAIFFAFSFADARYWPTIGEAAAASYFGWWGAVAFCAMVVDWTAQYTSSYSLTFLSLVLWFISSGLAVLSLVRILYIGNPRRLNEYQAKSLAKLLNKGKADRFLRATREATTIGADLMVRDLTDQLELALRDSPPRSYNVRIAAEFVSEVTWECYGGGITGLTAARAMRRVLAPETVLSTRVDGVDSDKGREHLDVVAQHALEVIVPLLTRFIGQARYFSERGERRSYEPVISAGESLLGEFAVVFDPAPQVQESELARHKLDLKTDQVLSIYRAFSIRPNIATPASIYSVYQHVTGNRFPGDYWKSDPIVSDLVEFSGSQGWEVGLRVAGIFSESLLSWTLPPLVKHLDTNAPSEGKDLIASSAWLKIMLSQGSLGSASDAMAFWRETVLRYRIESLAPGGHDSSVYEIAVGAAALSILRLRPWVNAYQFREARDFFHSLEQPFQERVDALLSRVVGITIDGVSFRVVTQLKEVVLDG